MASQQQIELVGFTRNKPAKIKTKKQCRDCCHAQRWRCGGRFFYYCGIRVSNRTQNGQLKIKLKDQACDFIESVEDLNGGIE